MNFDELKLSYFDHEIKLSDNFNLVLIYNDFKHFDGLTDWVKSRVQIINNNMEIEGDSFTNNMCYTEVFKEMMVKTICSRKLNYVYNQY